MAVSEGNFAGITPCEEVMSEAAQDEVIAKINQVKALFPDPTTAVSSGHTDFDRIGAELRTKLRTLFDELAAAVEAAPTA